MCISLQYLSGECINYEWLVNFSIVSSSGNLKGSSLLFNYSFCLQLETVLYKYKLLKILETTVKFRKRVHHIDIKL